MTASYKRKLVDKRRTAKSISSSRLPERDPYRYADATTVAGSGPPMAAGAEAAEVVPFSQEASAGRTELLLATTGDCPPMFKCSGCK